MYEQELSFEVEGSGNQDFKGLAHISQVNASSPLHALQIRAGTQLVLTSELISSVLLFFDSGSSASALKT